MSINLNEDSFNAKEGVAIFNSGTAGIAENVTLSIQKKGADDKDGSPEYKVIFTDESDASCNTAFWYITEATIYATVDEQITKKGKIFKHLLHAMYGADFEIPSFKDAKDMLDSTMKLLREGSTTAGKFRVFTNYGTKEHSKKYIQPRSWVPFVESMEVADTDTRLKAGDLDAMTRLQEDVVVPETTAGGDDWD